MRLDEVGPQQADPKLLEPIVVPIAGFKLDGERVVTDITFRPVVPLGYALDMAEQISAAGEVPVATAIAYMNDCVMPESREAWHQLLNSPEVMVDQQTLVDCFTAVTEAYGERPTLRSSDSVGGPPDTDSTSGDGAASPASTSRKKRSGKGSTSSKRS